MKPIVLGVVIRKKNKQLEILTQTRQVINKEYDPLYDGTEEVVGETIKEGENVIETLIRGCQEELGSPELIIDRIIGADSSLLWGIPGAFFTTGKNDKILGFTPYYFVQQLSAPQPWLGPCFVVQVEEGFEPQLDKEKEVSAHTWWDPKVLLTKMENEPSGFMGLHYPFLIEVCRDVISGKLQ